LPVFPDIEKEAALIFYPVPVIMIELLKLDIPVIFDETVRVNMTAAAFDAPGWISAGKLATLS